MATGVGVLAPAQISSKAKIVGYDKQLRMKAVPADIYTRFTEQYNTEKKVIPNAIIFRVDEAALSDSTEAKITMLLPLSGPATYGNDYAIGGEERPSTRTVTIYRNNLRKTVTKPGYGVRQLDAKGYNLYEKHVDGLALWNEEHEGLEIRQAMLERFGETLMYGDTAATCIRNWNMNIFVCGLPKSTARPTYSATVDTYTTNIVQKLQDSGGGSIKIPHVGQTLNQPNLSSLSNFCLDRRLSRLKIPSLPGGMGFILTISELQATYLGDPAWSQRNLGALYTLKTALAEKVQNWPGVLGAYKDLLIVEDVRQPTIDITGTSKPYGLSGQYIWPGDDDQRNRDQDTVVDTCFILGRGSYINWYPQKLRHISQLDDYEAIHGHGTQLVRGMQTPHYTDDSDLNPEQYSSAVALCRLPDYI